MTKIPPSMIFLLNFVFGLPAVFVFIGFIILFFDVFSGGIFSNERDSVEIRPLMCSAPAVLMLVAYVTIPFFVTKWLISDSPYWFEYWVASVFSFLTGVVMGFYLW